MSRNIIIGKSTPKMFLAREKGDVVVQVTVFLFILPPKKEKPQGINPAA
jgi:hypothetical protein